MSWFVSIRKGNNPLELHTFNYKHHAEEFIRKKTILEFPGKWSKLSLPTRNIYTLNERGWVPFDQNSIDIHENDGYYEFPDMIIVIELSRQKDDSEWKPY